MSVNLKGRKSAKSDQAEAPAPQELVMAGAQTPWATEQSPGSPFADQGMPSLPPPPPPYAPGEEPAEAEADAKKSPFSKPMVIALAAVIAVGGGGYYYLNMGSSSSTPAPKAHTLTPAQLAALRAKAAAGAKAGTTGAAAAKPTAAVVKPGTAKAVVPPVKTVVPPGKKTTPKPAVGNTKTSTSSSSTPAYTAALPGAINGWDKQIVTKAPTTLASFDTVLGATVSNVQVGVFGGTAADPYLIVETGDHSKNPTGKAMDLLKNDLKQDRAAGIAVSKPFFVPHTPWGGSAACATEAGTTKAGDDESAVICSWVDNNTVGTIFASRRIASQALPLLNSVRSQIEK